MLYIEQLVQCSSHPIHCTIGSHPIHCTTGSTPVHCTIRAHLIHCLTGSHRFCLPMSDMKNLLMSLWTEVFPSVFCQVCLGLSVFLNVCYEEPADACLD